jgi:4-amino-4-deoxy-L-arabinose transferase-like glycosyltransferase
VKKTSDNKLDWALVALLSIGGVALRGAYLLRVPPFLDEYSSILTGMSILRTGGLPELPSGVLYPSGSFFSYLEAAFIGLFGFSDLVARLPSLLLAGLTLPLLYVVARRLFNRRVALLSVALLAMTPEAVVWGGRARMYSLLQLLALLTVYFFYLSVLDPGSHREGDAGRLTPAWPWVVCFVAAIFAQDEAILLLPVFLLAALVARGPRWFLKPGVLLGQILVPVAGVAARYWLNKIRVPGEVYTLSHEAFFRFPPALAHGLTKIAPFFTAPWIWPVSLLFLVALGFLAWQEARGRGQEARGRRQEAGGKKQETRDTQHATRNTLHVLRFTPPTFFTYVFFAIAALMLLVVNDPWQDDRYLFIVLPLFLVLAAWGLDQVVAALARRWPALRGRWATVVLVAVVAAAGLPGGLSALRRYEPDYGAAYRWLATQLAADDLVATMRPAPAAVYLGRCDFLVAQDKYQEFVMRLNGVWLDRWAGARVLESPEAFRDEALKTGRRVWFVIDEDRFASAAYTPEFVALVLSQMDLVWHQGGVLVFEGQGYRPPPEMAVTRSLDADFADQLRLTGYALSTDQPEPGQALLVQLYWQAIRPERNYTVFLHVVGSDGQGLTQVDGEPFLGLYGMSTLWPRDQVVTDERTLTLPATTPPGHYRLEVGLYDANDPAAAPLPLVSSGASSLTLDYLKIDVVPPPEPSRSMAEGNLGGLARLVGYDLPQPEVVAGAALPLTLTWECLGTFAADYTVFVHLAGADGQPVAQADSPPLGGTYPTRFWDVGERLADPYTLDISTTVPPGEYELRVGLYLPATGERLPLLDAEGRVLGDYVLLGQVEVMAP